MNFALIKNNPEFLKLWISQVVSQIGTRMFQLATVWWLANLTEINTSLMVGIYLAGCAIPPLLLAKKTGFWIDHFGPRKILLRADVTGISLSVLLAIGFFSIEALSLQLTLLLLLGWALSTCQSVIEPTLNKAMPEIVDKDEIDSAVAFLSSTGLMAGFIGAIFGALAIETLGIVGISILNGLTFVWSWLLDGRIRFPKNEQSPVSGRTAPNLTSEDTSSNKNSGPILESGWQILKKYRIEKLAILGFAGCNLFSVPTMMVIPLYVSQVLNGTARDLGFVEGCLSAGLILGYFLAGYFPLKKKIYEFSSIVFFLLAVSLTTPFFFQNLSVYAVSLFVSTLSLGVLNVRFLSHIHRQINNAEKGRFFAFFTAIISSMNPFGYLLFSVVSGLQGVVFVCLLQGIGVATVSLYFIFLSRINKAYLKSQDADSAEKKISEEGGSYAIS